MQLSLTLLLATIASLELVAASSRAGSPRSSLQNKNDATKAYQRRQARSRDIVRRAKEGPRKRQISLAVCADPIGGEKVRDGNFEGDNSSAWPMMRTGIVTSTFDNSNVGSSAEGSSPTAFAVTKSGSNVGSASISQTTTVCAQTTYLLTWNSGIATPPSNPGPGPACNLAVFIGDQQVSTGRPCTDASQPCMAETDRPEVMYRPNQYLYFAQADQTVELMFSYQCDGADGTVKNLVDDVSFTRFVC